MSDEVERTLCQLPQVHVFKIPVRKSSEGHRASDWPTTPAWTGRVKIVAKGKLAVILLVDSENKTFAVCPVTDDTAVERTLDSGRYFVLRIQNAQKQKAFIGIAFNERNDAFDFNVALSDFKSECERDELASRGELESSLANKGPAKDFSLKEGEKIKINISGGLKKDKPATTTTTSTTSAAGGNGKLLPPPKGTKSGLLAPPPADVANGNTPPSSSSSTSSSSSSTAATNDWNSLDASFGEFSISKQSPNPTPNSNTADPFGAFGSSDPFATSSSSSFPTTVFTSSTDSDPFGAFTSSSSSTPASSSSSSSSSDFPW